MLYNNPPIYKNDVTPDILVTLADVETVVCFKDSSGDTRRFIDTRNMVGDRFVLFAGLDDVIVESVAMGAVGWVSGMSNAFPREGETLFRLAKAGRYAEAMPLYEWFMPLLAPRCPPGPGPVHQALRAHHGPRHRPDPPAAPCAAAAREGSGRGHDGEGAEEPAAVAECRAEGGVSGLFRGTHLRVQASSRRD